MIDMRTVPSILLMALAGIGLTGIPSIWTKQTVGDKPRKIDNMFPDGVDHDFGKVKYGTVAKHAFRIVNTSNVPLRISVRIS